MLRSSLSILVIVMATSTWAHQDGTLHSHPHLLISNEFLVGILLLATVSLAFTARLILRKSYRRQRRDWMQK